METYYDDSSPLIIYINYHKFGLSLETWLDFQVSIQAMFDITLEEEGQQKFDKNTYTPLKPVLIVERVETGRSITLTLKDGWKPSIIQKDGKVEIGLPKPIGKAGLIGYFLLQAASSILDLDKNILESTKLRIEIENMRTETRKKLENKSKEIIIDTLKNDEIIGLRINNALIKEIKQDR